MLVVTIFVGRRLFSSSQFHFCIGVDGAITTKATKQAEHFLEGIGAVRWYGNSLTVVLTPRWPFGGRESIAKGMG